MVLYLGGIVDAVKLKHWNWRYFFACLILAICVFAMSCNNIFFFLLMRLGLHSLSFCCNLWSCSQCKLAVMFYYALIIYSELLLYSATKQITLFFYYVRFGSGCGYSYSYFHFCIKFSYWINLSPVTILLRNGSSRYWQSCVLFASVSAWDTHVPTC